jgi:hypothetical protein
MSFWDTIRDYAEEYKLDWDVLVILRGMVNNSHFLNLVLKNHNSVIDDIIFQRYYDIKEKRPSRLAFFGDVVAAMAALEERNFVTV